MNKMGFSTNKIIIFLAIAIAGIFFILPHEETIPASGEPVFEEEKKIEIESEAKAEEIPSLEDIKGFYVTSWSASKESYIKYIVDLASTTEINGVVIDIKDWSGKVAYDSEIEEVEEYGAESVRFDAESLLERLHKEGIYAIARITVFQDPVLAKARPDLAVWSKSGSVWLDNLGLAWIDPSAKESWDYNIKIAKEALKLGFDEVNFDYVRFPSDGNLADMVFPARDKSLQKHEIIRSFFKYLREQIPYGKLSVDLFGLSTSASNDLGVGQILEDGFEYFDYVCPMIYPSHFAFGFQNLENPAEHPYEVVRYSMESALKRLASYKFMLVRDVKLRPWLQDFDLGADYDAEMIRAQTQAVFDTNQNNFAGFLLWNSLNVYTKEALGPAE